MSMKQNIMFMLIVFWLSATVTNALVSMTNVGVIFRVVFFKTFFITTKYKY